MSWLGSQLSKKRSRNVARSWKQSANWRMKLAQPPEFYLQNALSGQVIHLPAGIDNPDAAVTQAKRQAQIEGGVWHVYTRIHLAQVAA